METISIGLDDPLLFKLLPSILIIIGFGITIWRIRAEANSQKALIEGQNKWKQDEKLRDQQEKYFDDFIVLAERIETSTSVDKNTTIKLQTSFIKSSRLFNDNVILDAMEKAEKIFIDNDLSSVTTDITKSKEREKLIKELNTELTHIAALIIVFLKK